jgi:hypothetical protein
MHTFCMRTVEEPNIHFNLLYLDPNEYLIYSIPAVHRQSLTSSSKSYPLYLGEYCDSLPEASYSNPIYPLNHSYEY